MRHFRTDSLARFSAASTSIIRFRPIPPPTDALIRELRAEGMSYRSVADLLNERQIPTAQGGKRWHAQTVANVVKRAAA